MDKLDYTLYFAQSDDDIALFWEWRDRYVREDILPNCTFEPATEEDYTWFFSKEYKGVIMDAFYRDSAKLRIVFLQYNGLNVGFAVYVIYHSEDGKCLIVEFNIDKAYRNNGIGSLFFNLLREHVKSEQATYFALNLSNENNERFWARNGFIKAGKDEHGSDTYEKRPL